MNIEEFTELVAASKLISSYPEKDGSREIAIKEGCDVRSNVTDLYNSLLPFFNNDSSLENAIKEEQKKCSGMYPNGKLNDNDNGQLAIALTTEKGNVKIQFAGPVTWLAMPPEQALLLAESIIEKVNELT